MFAECRNYLMNKLKDSGIHMEPVTSMKALRLYGDSHLAAVLFEEESINRCGSKSIYKDQTGASKQRKKIFNRELTFTVVIGEYDPEKAGAIYEEFLKNIGRGFYIDGNFVSLEPLEAEWVENADSILKAKIAIQLRVTFYGGIYADTGRINTGTKKMDIEVMKDRDKNG